ncbi:hypothetical protein MAM1_0079c04463 [Mucor ambiguus]|uniref:Uncharacterized protein n=1 Tax=Mucor ambiguus TaxID=91626 RepID=A0A0C9LUG7_9FUNG|nr:hypothetical protein MAM1_0079c04463 [Mucor ambiguus]
MEFTRINDFVSAIESGIEALSDSEVTFNSILDYLQPTVVDLYDGSDFSEYKRDWNRHIRAIASTNNIDFLRTRGNWESIYHAVIAKLAANNYDWQPKFKSPGRRSSCRSSSSSASVATSTTPVESSADSDSPSVKLPKLSSIDKENIRLLYDRLDRNKMWKLSNGTVVEDKMREVAFAMEHEQ